MWSSGALNIADIRIDHIDHTGATMGECRSRLRPRLLLAVGLTLAFTSGTVLDASAPAIGASPSCRLPLGTTIGAIDPPVPGTTGLASLPKAPRNVHLPQRVTVRTPKATFNHSWSFALAKGRIYTMPATGTGGWRAIRMPGCLAGTITAISADDQTLFAIGAHRRIYSMAQALNAPALWNWTSRWGTPLWLGEKGFTLPANTISWSGSQLDRFQDKTWTDRAGHAQHIYGEVTHIYALTGDGSHLTMMDPWLPLDYSYAVPTPHHGRFRSIAVSASGSEVFVINRLGDMYTRLYDFDMSGSNTAVLRYSYQDQRSLPAAPEFGLHLLPNYAAIQLPAVGWVHQPKIPGVITSAISVNRTGAGSSARELRVEGRRAGRTGYWHKMVDAPRWRFTRTGGALSATPLSNPRRDTSAQTLSPPHGHTYTARTARYRAALGRFASDSDRTNLRLTFPGGATLPLVLHTVDGLRQTPRAAGLDDHARAYTGAVEVPIAVLHTLAKSAPAVRSFVTSVLAGERFTKSTISATTHDITISALDLTLHR